MSLELEIDGTTQYATLYRDGKPIATLARRRVYESGPEWRAFDTSGKEIRRFYLCGSSHASYMAREIEKALAKHNAPLG